MLLGAELLDDVREEVLDSLGLGFSTDDEGVVLDGSVCFGVLEVEDGVVVSEEIDLVNPQRMGADLLDNGLDNLVVASLSNHRLTVVLLTTFTFLRWDPFPPVRASPTLFLSLSMFA